MKRKKQKKKLGKRFKIALLATVIVVSVIIIFLIIDWDRDGLATITELRGGTSAFNPDTDGDGLKDGLEVNTYMTNPLIADTDGDGLSDGLEVNTYGTNPLVADTDNDGLSDELEVNTYSSNPLVADTDGDGLSDGQEVQLGCNLFSTDTDSDGLRDGSDPHPTIHEWKLMDSDNDGWSDYKEYYETNTDRFNSDTDGDGAPDPYDAHPLSAARTIRRDFSWEYPAGTPWTWTVNVSHDLYLYESQLPRIRNWSDWSQYTLDPTVKTLASGLKVAANQRGFDYYETASFMLAFVQSLPYTSDSVTTAYDEYPRYPLETLVDGGGDCEDTSFLTAGIFREMGYDAVLVLLPGHAATAVWGHEDYPGTYYRLNNKNYYFCETTGEGWGIGQLPSVFNGVSATLYSVGTPTNMLSPPAPARFEISNLSITPTTVSAGGSVTISVKVANVGGTRGTYTVTLEINNKSEGNQQVTLASGAYTAVTFTVSKTIPGTYDVKIGQLTGTFTVGLPQGWHSVVTFTGTGDTTTSTFYISKNNFRIYWEAKSDSWLPYLSYYVYLESGWLWVSSDRHYEAGAGVTSINAGPGNFYINVYAANLNSWTLLVAAPD